MSIQIEDKQGVLKQCVRRLSIHYGDGLYRTGYHIAITNGSLVVHADVFENRGELAKTGFSALCKMFPYSQTPSGE